MASRQRIPRIRRDYNQWVANQTLEDYALRFTAKSARRWSAASVANTALGAISFLMLEAIGGTLTLRYGFANVVPAVLLVAVLIFATGVPISYHAARHGVDIDLLTRGAGFGYFGSTLASLIYATFTFTFFALEAVILAATLHAWLGLPEWIGCVVCVVAVIPLVTHGVTFIGRLHLVTQPVWIALNVLPFAFVLRANPGAVSEWTHFAGSDGGGLSLSSVAAAGAVMLSLVSQIGEQVDFLRFLPPRETSRGVVWWSALLAGGPGWIVPGTLKLLAGSFLACLATHAGIAGAEAAQPALMYRVAFATVLPSATASLALASCLVVVSQVKINVTNAYAGSIAWSNFFSRLTHSHPGRVVWVVFNGAIALMLMEFGVYRAIEHTLVAYSSVAAAWIGALVADLVVNKPLGLSPPGIEFKRAHLYDVNPVGVGAMLGGVALALAAGLGALGELARAGAPFLGFAAAFAAAPLIAWATGGRFYLARRPRRAWGRLSSLACVVCENAFEPEDMASCPAYGGAICSLCCSLDARCQDMCRPHARIGAQTLGALRRLLPARAAGLAAPPAAPLAALLAKGPLGRFAGVMCLLLAAISALLLGVYAQTAAVGEEGRAAVAGALAQAFVVLAVIAGVVAWLLVLAQESRQAAQAESHQQTGLLLREIEAHTRTDAKLQRAKEVAEAANVAKSRYVVGLSHELRTPLNAILGYAQLLERDPSIPERRRHSLRVIRRSGEHLAGLIEGLLDISRIEAGRIDVHRDEVRLGEFLEQIVSMFRLQAEAKGIGFVFTRPQSLPGRVVADERRLRQVLINLLSNALKFTAAGQVRLGLLYRNEVAEFVVEDTGIGIATDDHARIFEPFQRIEDPGMATEGVGLGLTLTRLLVQIMGGEITLDSAPERGSRFRVRLMLATVHAAAWGAMAGAAMAGSVGAGGGAAGDVAAGGIAAGGAAGSGALQERRVDGYEGRRRDIVVADDDAAHRELLDALLVPLGFALRHAADGEACLRLAEARMPDLFLIDIAMPGMGGWELARRLRAAPGPRAPILVVSANAGELRQQAGAEGGHDAILTKPVSLDALLDRIGRMLGVTWRLAAAPHQAPSPGAAALTPRQLDELRQLAAIGYVRGIHARLGLLEQESPDAAACVAHLRVLVSEFRMDEFMATLDAAGGPSPATDLWSER